MGSDTFFENFVSDNLRIINRICRAYARDPEEMKDYVQEVTIQLWKSYEKFKGNSQVSTWVYRVTLNVCLSLSKKGQRRVETVSILPNDIPEEGIDPQQEQLAKLYAAMKKLKDTDRAILLLYLEDKSYTEMADILGITVTNVGAKVNRAKNQLKSIIR
ncbi:sigma-70 family RNA polymerase sigma factor [Fulvivirga maritima]|uniref:RNA polymerase sigma factor n=1 Tax=Fulvivirga maritima TaxID=2904247 RepID=UPI001F2BB83D|nr:sigma-70 family RNA polymerase sigma factor [Fulvivirga maritima]UII28044.1 sigma-70 family RNA polymerase sigma factor [Fulvivirga maritima]